MDRHVLLYSVYGAGPPPLPPPPPAAVEDDYDDEVVDDEPTEEMKEYWREIDRRTELGQAEYRQQQAADEFAMRMIGVGIAATIIHKATHSSY